jgi:methylenetetrahydrofolate dehydrogenase (NADP+)/methenyltetrahydrofolate cyclohydrolase
MPAALIDGKSLATQVRASLKERIAALAARGIRPGLAAVLVGDDPASHVYVRNKTRACEETGIRSERHHLPAEVPEKTLLERIAALNADRAVHGILVQLPLPGRIDADRVLAAVSPAKDVDGFHAASLGALLQGRPGFVPGTPAGVMRLLEHARVPLAGRRAVIVGRSTIVGKPLALLLLQKDATVTICHSKTADLAGMTRQADILVAAAGRAKLVTADMVKPGACVIDVGINRLPDGKLAGDVDFASVKEVAGWITPVPGGVGPMTVAMMMVNAVRAAETALG